MSEVPLYGGSSKKLKDLQHGPTGALQHSAALPQHPPTCSVLDQCLAYSPFLLRKGLMSTSGGSSQTLENPVNPQRSALAQRTALQCSAALPQRPLPCGSSALYRSTTVTSTMRRAAHPSGCARCDAVAGCSAIEYQSPYRSTHSGLGVFTARGLPCAALASSRLLARLASSASAEKYRNQVRSASTVLTQPLE